MAPQPRLVKSVAMPERLATINYTGGSLTASRGVLAAMFKGGKFAAGCESVLRDRSVKQYVRTEYVGAPVRNVDAFTYQEVKYNSQTKSLAAGGEAIKLRINGEYWTARLSGNHSNFMTWLCGQNEEGNIDGAISWLSERGTFYGPVGTLSDGEN